MGNRVKGRVKKSSVKAALSSSAGSKRKLSRMGKKQKKEHSGLEASFIGRSACIKMLQLSIKDFRKLCILKGVYPREPVGRVPGKKKGQSFYHIKDIRAIAHEPILEKFREFRAFMKKVCCDSLYDSDFRPVSSSHILTVPRTLNRFVEPLVETKATKRCAKTLFCPHTVSSI
jgi:Pescadillo N-terminus